MKKLILIVGMIFICGICRAESFSDILKRNEDILKQVSSEYFKSETWADSDIKFLFMAYRGATVREEVLQNKYDELFLDYAEQVAEIRQLKERIKLLEESLGEFMKVKIGGTKNYDIGELVFVYGKEWGRCRITEVLGYYERNGWLYKLESPYGEKMIFERDLMKVK